MALYFLALKSKAYPDITNRIRGSVKTWDGATTIVSIIDDNAGHPARLWSYPGLQRANYQWVLEEINGSGIAVQTLSEFDVTPSTIDGLLTRDKEQLQVDATNSGLVSGESTATLDGTDNKPDFRGWKIAVAQYGDIRNLLVEHLDYLWDESTGVLELLQSETFQPDAWWTFLFIAQSQTQGNSSPIINDYSTRLLTETGNILYEDFGNAILIKQTGIYAEYQLPDITTIPVGRQLEVEIGGSTITASKFLPYSADPISFLNGLLVGYPGESFIIVRYQNPDLSNEWRVKFPSGNFRMVGCEIGQDQIQSGVNYAKLLSGTSEDRFQFCRIYEDYVLLLPVAQRCNYDDWATGNNKYLFSLANSSNPANADKFMFPNRKGISSKNNDTGKAGDYQADQVGESTLMFTFPTGDTFNGHPYNPTALGKGLKINTPFDLVLPLVINAGLETRVKSYLTNKYVLI